MTFEDRDLLAALRRQQAELQQTLTELNARLSALEARVGQPQGMDALASLPPIPPEAFLPPVPLFAPPPPPSPLAFLPPVPPPPPAPKPAVSYESHFARWFIRVGALLGIIVLCLILASHRVQGLLGHAGELAVSALVCIGVISLGERMERRGGGTLVAGRIAGALALAWLYLTAWAVRFYTPLELTESDVLGGLLLFSWSVYALYRAKLQRSQLLGIFALTLAFAATALNPLARFTMGADLILAALTSAFLLRYGWTTLAMFGAVGAYGALLHRLLVDETGELVLDTSRTLAFLPHAIYLAIAWAIFTGAAILTTKADFRGGKRFGFLSLNNAAFAGLLALTAYIAGYGPGAIGWSLLDTGLIFLAASRFASVAEIEPVDVMGAYAAQGLALFGAGTIVIFTGISRAVALLVETLLMGIAGAFSGDRILIVSTYVIGTLATFFFIWEIAVYEHHPWLLGFGGALVMLMNAWSCRGEVRNSPAARTTVIASTLCYSLMAVALVFTTIYVKFNDSTVPVVLALAAMVLTYAVYYVTIYELPGVAQLLLLAAQILVLFPVETGEDLPWWTTFWVAAISLLLITWWARQGVLRINAAIIAVTFLYALALAGLAYQAIRPQLDAPGWLVTASLLSIVFLVYGALARVWALALVGQLFLFVSLYHLFLPPQRDVFPWSWWVAVMPIIVLYASGRGALAWLRAFSDFPDSYRTPVRLIACAYELLAITAIARVVFGLTTDAPQWVAAFFFLGTLLLSLGVRRHSSFSVRCSFALSAAGMLVYFAHLQQAHAMATYLNALGMLLFLSQAGLLRHEGRSLITSLEAWGLIVFAVLTNWIFVSAWVWTRGSPEYLTLGWALFALFLFLFGLVVRDRRIRWCGMAIIMAAILHVLFHDLWHLSGVYRVLTFFFVMVILLAIGVLSLLKSQRR